MLNLIDQLHRQGEAAIEAAAIRDYVECVDGLIEAWTTVRAQVARFHEAYSESASPTAVGIVDAIHRALGSELESAIRLGRLEFAVVVLREAYRSIFRALSPVDQRALNVMYEVLARGASYGAEVHSRTGLVVFDYAVFRLFEVARVQGHRLTDVSKERAARVDAGAVLLVFFARIEALLHDLVGTGSFRQVVVCDQRWGDIVEKGGAESGGLRVAGGVQPTTESADDPASLLIRLRDFRLRTRFVLGAWCWSRPYRRPAIVIEQVRQDLSSQSDRERALLLALSWLEDSPTAARWWLSDEEASDSSSAVIDGRYYRRVLIETYLWLTIAEPLTAGTIAVTTALSGLRAELLEALKTLGIPEQLAIPGAGHQAAVLRDSLEALAEGA